MRPMERDAMLMVLAVTAGSADGWSYFGLGHAFVANMTGNTVLLGMAVFQRNGDLLHPAITLACYAAGAALATFLTRNVRQGSMWPRAVSWTLVLEALAMMCCEAGWAAVRMSGMAPAPAADALDCLQGGVAFAIGLQSGAMLQLKVPGIVTTYITGTWTTLMNGLVLFGTRKEQRTPGQNAQFEERLLMQGVFLAVYFLSAVLTGWVLRHAPLGVGAISAASVLLAGVYGAARHSERKAPRSQVA